MSRCPSISIMCKMSLVLLYSVVAFQCRKVWNVIFLNLGFFSLVVIRARYLLNVFLNTDRLPSNMKSLFFDSD